MSPRHKSRRGGGKTQITPTQRPCRATNRCLIHDCGDPGLGSRELDGLALHVPVVYGLVSCNEVSAAEFLGHGVARRRRAHSLFRSARRGFPPETGSNTMVLIGVDPYKASHTAVAVHTEGTTLGRIDGESDRHQVERLLKEAIDFPGRRWAIESANGLGFLLAQQLVAAGEVVVDVPPILAARVGVLGSGTSQNNDPNDASSTAIAALRAKTPRTVVAENHGAVLRLLADHHHDVGSLRTQARCRLHAVVRCPVPGGTRLSTDRAAAVLRSMRPGNAVDAERANGPRFRG